MLSGFRANTAIVRITTTIAFCCGTMVSLPDGKGQTPSKEYVRLGTQVIAIEEPSFVINVNPAGFTTGSLDNVQFTASVPGCPTCAVTWSVSDTSKASIGSTSGILSPIASAITAPTTVSVTATLSGASPASTTLTILPALSPTSAGYGVVGGTGSFVVDKLGSWCATISGSGTPVTLTGPSQYLFNCQSNCQIDVANSTGPVTVTYNGAGNQSGVFTINVSGSSFSTLPFTITESSAALSVNPPSITVPGTSGSRSFNVTVAQGSGATWQIDSLPPWIYLPSNETGLEDSSQSASMLVTFDFNANPYPNMQQTGSICLDSACGVLVSVVQTDGLAFNPPAGELQSSNAQQTVSVIAPAGTGWTATVEAGFPWLFILNGASGTGNGTLTYNASSNNPGGTRTGYIDIGGLRYMVTQAGGSAVTISPASWAFYQAGHTETFTASDAAGGSDVGWTLTPSSGYGSINSMSGSQTTFTSPSINLNGIQIDTLTATAPSGYATASVLLNYPGGSGSLGWSGSGSSAPGAFQTFLLTIPSFSNHYQQYLDDLQVLITANTSGAPWPSASNSCQMTWNLKNSIFNVLLSGDTPGANDEASIFNPSTGNAGTLANSQCELDLSRTTAQINSGNLDLYI